MQIQSRITMAEFIKPLIGFLMVRNVAKQNTFTKGSSNMAEP